MSSSAYKTIYDHAAAIVQAKLSKLPGIETLLIELGKKVPADESDPRIHRDLFFEPRIDAQQIGVPIETAEEAAVLLQQIGVLRLWVRVNCPDVDEYEVGTVLETDEPKDFDSLASKSCDYCGRYHELGWDECETLYAINTRPQLTQRAFDYSRLRSKKQATNSRSNITNLDQKRCENITGLARSDVGLPAMLVMALKSNDAVQDIPSPMNVWQNAWTGPILILILHLLLIIPVARFAGERLAWGTTALVLCVVFLVIRGHVQATLAPTIVQRTAMYMGFPISAGCFTAGATGLRIKAAAESGTPWWTRVEFGEHSNVLIGSGVILFVTVLVFVWGFDYSRGWLQTLVSPERERL